VSLLGQLEKEHIPVVVIFKGSAVGSGRVLGQKLLLCVSAENNFNRTAAAILIFIHSREFFFLKQQATPNPLSSLPEFLKPVRVSPELRGFKTEWALIAPSSTQLI
jgi:hypothetical protein